MSARPQLVWVHSWKVSRVSCVDGGIMCVKRERNVFRVDLCFNVLMDKNYTKRKKKEF